MACRMTTTQNTGNVLDSTNSGTPQEPHPMNTELAAVLTTPRGRSQNHSTLRRNRGWTTASGTVAGSPGTALNTPQTWKKGRRPNRTHGTV